MKRLIFLLVIIIPMLTFAQTNPSNADILAFVPVSAQRVHQSDSVQIFATLTSSTTVAGITWSQPTGQTVKFTPATTYYGNATATSSFWIVGLAPGTYTFNAVGKNAIGSTTNTSATLTVIPDQVCPSVPLPRVLTSVVVKVGNQMITLSAAELQNIKYADGSSQ